MEKNYCIITNSERAEAHLAQAGIDSVFMNIYIDTEIEDIQKMISSQIVIIMGGGLEVIRRAGRKLADSVETVRCYTTNIPYSDLLDEPLSSLIDSEDAEKIERVTSSFGLKPFVL